MHSVKVSKATLAVLALIIANMIWGAAAPIFKWSLENIEPFTLGFLRFFIASLVLLPFVLHKLHLERKDIGRIILLSLFGITIHIGLFLLGLQYASSINAPIISSSGPIFLILASIVFLKERPKSKAVIGTIVSLLGVMVIVFRPILDEGIDGAIFGNLLFVLATLLHIAYTILLKQISPRYATLTLTFWIFAIGALGFFPFALFESGDHGLLTGLNMQGLIGILFGAFFSSVAAYILFTYGVKHIKANEVGIFTYIDPVVAVIIAIPLLGETITTSFVLGAFLVFLGIFVAEGRINYHPFHKLRG